MYFSFQYASNSNNSSNNKETCDDNSTNYNTNNYYNSINTNSFSYNGHVDKGCPMPAAETVNMMRPAAVEINPPNVLNNCIYNNGYNDNLSNCSCVLQQSHLLTPYNGQGYNTNTNISGINTNSSSISTSSVQLPSMQMSTCT